MAIPRKQRRRNNQVAAMSPPTKSRHGGSRPGAGRKPGSGNKRAFALEPCAGALVKAVAGKPAFLFITAMQALEAPLDDVREALGLSRDQFITEYGAFLTETAEMRRRGSAAYFGNGNAGAKG